MGLCRLMDKENFEKRRSPRFNVFLKAIAEKISQFSGTLEDISESGCKVRFPKTDVFDMDEEYSMTVFPQPNSNFNDFNLLVKPCWTKQTTDETLIGFHVLHSPGYKQFSNYVASFIAKMAQQNERED